MKRFIIRLTFGLLLFLCTYSASFAAGADSSQISIHALRSFDRPLQPDLYILRPGDKLTVTFIEATVSAIGLKLDTEGRIVQRSIGVIDAAGRTLSDVKAELLTRLKAVYEVDKIVIALSQPAPVAVSIIGHVPRPGIYLGYAWQTVSEVIDSAGGVLPSGSSRLIKFSGGPQELTVDLHRIFDSGNPIADPPLYAGRIIFVPEARQQKVLIVGAVNQPGPYELLEEDTIDDLIQIAGGLIDTESKNRIEIFRGGERLPASTTHLIDGDIISVPREDEARGPMLSVYGAIRNSGHYSFETNKTVDQLLATAGGKTVDANMERAALYRRPAIDDWQESGNERFLLHLFSRPESSQEIKLVAGDSLFVPFNKGYVRLDGDVLLPGLYPYVEDNAVSFYIGAAGLDRSNDLELLIILSHPATGFRVSANMNTLVRDGDNIIVRYVGEAQ